MVVAQRILAKVRVDKTAARDRLNSGLETVAMLKAENDRLRRIAAHVPAHQYIKASEAAGFGQAIRNPPSILPASIPCPNS